MAQTYRERQIDPRRAIELYEEVVTENPDDDATLKALSELYEREGDDAGLASSLRRMLELDERRVVEAMARTGKSADAPKEWPVAKRAERLTQLRRLALLYETRLADVDGVVYACSAVLELLTGDRDALERMERVLEKAGDPRLEQTLEYHAAAVDLARPSARSCSSDSRSSRPRARTTSPRSSAGSRRCAHRRRIPMRSPHCPSSTSAPSDGPSSPDPRAARRWQAVAHAGHARGCGARARASSATRSVLDHQLGDRRARDQGVASRARADAEESHRARRARRGCIAPARKWRELADVLGHQVVLLRRLACCPTIASARARRRSSAPRSSRSGSAHPARRSRSSTS